MEAESELRMETLKENLREAKAKADLAELMVLEQKQKVQQQELIFREELRVVKATASKAEVALVRNKIKKVLTPKVELELARENSGALANAVAAVDSLLLEEPRFSRAQLELDLHPYVKATLLSDSESSSAYLTTPINNKYANSSSDEEQMSSLVTAIKKYATDEASSVPNSP